MHMPVLKNVYVEAYISSWTAALIGLIEIKYSKSNYTGKNFLFNNKYYSYYLSH